MIKHGGWNRGLLLKQFCPRGHNKKIVGLNTQGTCNQCVKDRDNDPMFNEQNRNRRLLKLYRISLDEYNDMAIKQKHRCAICCKVRKLVVDHDHSTDKVRGLLCMTCNVILGSIKENIGILDFAIRYL